MATRLSTVPIFTKFHGWNFHFGRSILCSPAAPAAIGSKDKNFLPIESLKLSSKWNLNWVLNATTESTSSISDEEDGVSLGTMKLPLNIDLARFETLLFQVDKIPSGVRLGFTSIVDGKTEVPVYIDCLLFPGTENTSGPIFRAIRNGLLKAKAAPGEERIMRSLLGALQKSVEIARV